MRKYSLFHCLTILFCLCISCSAVYALPLTGFAQSDIVNVNIYFSDIGAVNIERKGMYPAELNGTHADSYANDLVSGATQTQTVNEGFSLSNTNTAFSSAGVSYTDIAGLPLSNNIYNGVTYSAFAGGFTNTGTHVRSYAIINDYWLFTVTAPVTITISFDYILSASGGATTLHGNLITEAVVGLGMGRNNTTWYDTNYTDNGLMTGTFSKGLEYLAGDAGNIYIWHGADILSTQSRPAPVPEPASIFLFCTGLIGFAGLRIGSKKH